MINKFRSRASWLACLFFSCAAMGAESGVTVYYTQNDLDKAVPAQPVKIYTKTSAAAASVSESVTVDTSKRFQKMAGVGAAFSEIGTLALAQLAPDQREALLKNLFDVKTGAGLSLCRLPIGASDFATSAYSFDDTPDDYEMKKFTLARDEKSIIPAVRAALAINPELKLHASPWSPPGWMKTTGRMDSPGENNKLRDDDKVYKAYALYFEKYLSGYQAAGITISRLCPQNEVDMSPKYPGCIMEPAPMVKLVTRFLAPQLKAANLQTEIWAGTFREGMKVDYAAECMKDEAFRKAITGLGIQYFNGGKVQTLLQQYPGLRLMHTEAECSNGGNNPGVAQSRLREFMKVVGVGCDTYTYWNMLLDEKHRSGWNWSQNSLVIIDRQTKEVHYNPDYQPVYLLSKFVRPGVVRVATTYKGGKNLPAMAFVGADKSTLVIIQTKPGKEVVLDLTVDGKSSNVFLPPSADCAVVCK